MKNEMIKEPVKGYGNYKQTEIGLIPDDWDVIKVGDTAEVKRGAGSQYLKYVDESCGIRFIRINDFFENKPVFVMLSKDILRFSICDRDILFAGTGNTAGESFTPPNQWLGLPHSYNAPRIRVDKAFDKGFIAHSLKSSYVINQQRALFVGAAQPFLDINAISSFFIALPKNIAEQTAIAEALSDADAMIASLEQLIEKKKKIKQGAMQELLSPTDANGKMKKGWVKKKLGEVAEIYQPETISQEHFSSDGYLVYGANGIVGKYLKYNHKEWQVTITCRGSTCGTVNKTENECWITGNAMVINVDSNQNINKTFLYFLLSKQDFTTCITGSGQPQIVRTPLAEFQVIIPDMIEEQKKIASILKEMDSNIQNLDKKLVKAISLKQGMMQNLLTGKIRLV